MSSSSVLFLAMMMAMGALVAFLGDLLGRRVGKKRLRLWSLRPRHTATMFTVIVGAIIPLLTVYGFVTISAPARQWIAKGTQLVAEVNDLTRERDKLTNERKQIQQEVTELRVRADSLSQEVTMRKTEMQRARREQNRLENLRKRAEAKTAEANRKYELARTSLERLEKQAEELDKKVHSLQEQNTTLSNSLEDKQREYEDLNRYSLELTQEILAKEKQIEEVEKIAQEKTKEAQELDERVLALGLQITKLRQEEQELNRAIEYLMKQMELLVRNIEAIRQSQLIFHRGEELARLIIPPGLSSDEAQMYLDEVQRMAHIAALERGVKPDENGRAAALDHRLRRLPDGKYVQYTVQEQIRDIKERVVNAPQEMVLLASAFYNYFKEDQENRLPVPLEISFHANRVVYKENQLVASITIDGSLPHEKIIEEITEFITRDVRAQAEQNGMIPVNGRPESLGSATVKQLSDLANQIRRLRKQVILEAHASKQTKSAEPLVLEFQIKTQSTKVER